MSLLAKIKKIFTDENIEEKLSHSFVELEVKPVYDTFPVDIGDIVYMNFVDDKGKPKSTRYSSLEVTEVDKENDTFVSRDYNEHNLPHYPRYEYYKFSMRDMMRVPYGSYYDEKIYSEIKYKAFTYREKLTNENEFWKGKPKSGDILYGKRYTKYNDTYGTHTTPYKVLGVTEEAFSAVPVYGDRIEEGDTIIVDIHTMVEITRKEDGNPRELFTTKDNAHTAYLHKELAKRKREDK